MAAKPSDFPQGVLPEQWHSFFNQQQATSQPVLQAFYEHNLQGDRVLSETPMVALDIETTGLDAQSDEIVSIGLVPFDARRIYCRQARYWLVRAQQLDDTSVTIHGITHSDVANAPRLESVLKELVPCLAGKQVVVHYRYMEREFLRRAVARLWNEVWLFPVLDTLQLEAEYLSRQRRWWQRLLKKPLPSLRLPNTRERYHLPVYGNHNALTDALATAELMQAQIQYWHAQKNATQSWWR